MVDENVTSLRIAVERHLKAKSRLPVRMVFQGDVFRFLFKGKGVLREGWLFLKKEDFSPKYYPPGWDTWVDSRGQGIKVFYPMRVITFLSWSPKKFSLGVRVFWFKCRRAFQENISFNFTKVALQDTD